ncbi:hypothetical protein OROGR_010098 [Orobanche gracilis]
MGLIILHGTTVMALLFDGGALLAADTKTTIEIGEDDDPVDPLEGYEEAELPVGSIVDEEKTLNIGDDMVVAHIGNTGWWKKARRDHPQLVKPVQMKTLANKFRLHLNRMCLHEPTGQFFGDRDFNVVVAGHKKDGTVEVYYTEGDPGVKSVQSLIHRRRPMVVSGSGSGAVLGHIRDFKLDKVLSFVDAHWLVEDSMLTAALEDEYSGGRIQK